MSNSKVQRNVLRILLDRVWSSWSVGNSNMIVFRAKRQDETLTQYVRYSLFNLTQYGLDYVNPSKFQDSNKLMRFVVFWVIRPSLGMLIWIWRKRKIDLLVKGCDQSSTKAIENKVEKALISQMNEDCIQVVEHPWDRGLDDGQLPVIVFCVISSRIGIDIENAMRGVHGKSPVILVLLHSVLKDLLRGDLSDDEELLDTTLRNRITGIAHFAFSDREGLYDCDQNTYGSNELFSRVNSLPSQPGFIASIILTAK